MFKATDPSELSREQLENFARLVQEHLYLTGESDPNGTWDPGKECNGADCVDFLDLLCHSLGLAPTEAE